MAIGRIRMSYDDFCRCTPEEFQAICKAWSEGENENYKAEWEMVRTLAAITIQPHCKNRIAPKKLLSFPWDRLKTTETREVESLTPEEKLKRFETLKDRLDGKQ